MKIDRFIKENSLDLSGKKVFFVGWTGSIGFEAVRVIASFKADLFLASRNAEKAEKKIKELREYCPSSKIEAFELDVSSLESIDAFISIMKKRGLHFDYLINNAGVYHLPPNKTKEGYDITFATNTLGHIRLIEKMMPFASKNAKVISTSSISYKFYDPDIDDIRLEKVDGKMKKYALSKREMLNAFVYIKENKRRDDVSMTLVHPGVVATELFEKSHGKLFMAVVFPLMKLVFHSPKKGMLGIIMALSKETRPDEWIGPSGLFEVWGYPSISKIKKDALRNSEEVYKQLQYIK